MGNGAGHSRPPITRKSTDTVNTMPCEACSVNFTIFRRKKLCAGCGRYHCSACLTKGPPTVNNQYVCQKCQLLTSGNFSRTELMQLTVKDLRSFLLRRNIPIQDCKEKVDLVETMLRFSLNAQYWQEQDIRQHHTSLLKERQKENEEHFREGYRSNHENQQAQDSVHGAIVSQASHSYSGSPTPLTRKNKQDPETPANRSRNENEVLTRTILPEDVTSSGTTPNLVSDNITDVDASPTVVSVSEGTTEFTTANSVESSVRMPRSNVSQSTGDSDVSPSPTNDERTTATGQIITGRIIKGNILEDIKKESDIHDLSVKQLKEILFTNFVDYTGCCEKFELVDRVKRLWLSSTENKIKVEEINQDGLSSNEHNVCKICMDAATDCVFLNCGHMVACIQCGKCLNECPICRQYVVRVVRVFSA